MSKPVVVIIRNAYAHDFGGGERFPVFLASQLSQQFEPVLISRSKKLLAFAGSQQVRNLKGWWWSRQNWSGVRVTLFPLYIVWQLILAGWYLKTFHNLKPSVVHIQSKDDFIAATIAAKFHRARIIWTDHADLKHVWLNVEKPLRNPVGKLVLRAARYADAITVVSQSEKKFIASHLKQHPHISTKLTVIYNGVEDRLDKFPQHPATTEVTFCVASRLVTDKGIGEVIEAFAKVNKQHPTTKLVIMGDGPESARFKQQAGSIKSITFLGHVDEPLGVMSHSDVFVHPTYHEGFSVALVEASMLGLPIIATDVGGNPEIIRHEETGLLVTVKDVDALATAMERLILDKGLTTRLGKNARKQYVEKFEFGAIVTKHFIPLYNKN